MWSVFPDPKATKDTHKEGKIVSFVSLATLELMLADPMPLQPFGRFSMLARHSAQREGGCAVSLAKKILHCKQRGFRVRAEAAKQGH
jgi:hypothetical protein